MPPEPVALRDAWRLALYEREARQERTRALRAELAVVRQAAKARRRVRRLQQTERRQENSA